VATYSFLVHDLSSVCNRSTRTGTTCVQRELPTLPEHLSSPPVLVGLCCSIFSWLCRAYRLYCKKKYVTKYISLGYL